MEEAAFDLGLDTWVGRGERLRLKQSEPQSSGARPSLEVLPITLHRQFLHQCSEAAEWLVGQGTAGKITAYRPAQQYQPTSCEIGLF